MNQILQASTGSLPLGVQHGEVEVNELEVASGRGIVVPAELRIEHFSHGAHTGMDLHTHG